MPDTRYVIIVDGERRQATTSQLLSFEIPTDEPAIVVDLVRHTLRLGTGDGHSVIDWGITARDAKILAVYVARAGWVVTRSDVADDIGVCLSSGSLANAKNKLTSKLELGDLGLEFQTIRDVAPGDTPLYKLVSDGSVRCVVIQRTSAY